MQLVPRHYDLSADWLNVLLQRYVPSMSEARSVKVTPLQGGYGYLSLLFRLDVEWVPGDTAGPASLIAKVPHTDRFSDMTASDRRVYRREAMFHQQVAPAAPIRTPKAYVDYLDPDTGAALFILEDLGHLQAYADNETIPTPKLEACLADLAGPHAKYWLSPDFDSMDWLAWPAKTGVDEVKVETFRRQWPRLVASGAYELSPAHLKLGELLSEKLDAVHDVLHNAPETMTHADLHQENIFFDGDRPVFIDWQHTQRSPAAMDVSKLTTSSIEPGEVEKFSRACCGITTRN